MLTGRETLKGPCLRNYLQARTDSEKENYSPRDEHLFGYLCKNNNNKPNKIKKYQNLEIMYMKAAQWTQRLSVCLSVCLCIHLSVYVTYLSIHTSIYHSLPISISRYLCRCYLYMHVCILEV